MTLQLSTNEIEDRYIRDNFSRLNEFLRNNLFEVPKRLNLEGNKIDFKNSFILVKEIYANTSFDIVNPQLGKLVVVEMKGNFTPTFPYFVTRITGQFTYSGTTVNWIHLLCVDEVAPLYIGYIKSGTIQPPF